MDLKKTIERAAKVAGNQTKLAEMLGITTGNLSSIKNGDRACGYKKKAQLAEIAGDDPYRVLLEGFSDELSENVPYEAQMKATIQGWLKDFPSETDEDPEVVARRWRKR